MRVRAGGALVRAQPVRLRFAVVGLSGKDAAARSDKAGNAGDLRGNIRGGGNPKHIGTGFKKKGEHCDVRPDRSTRNTGGAVRGTDCATSVIDRCLQSWDVPNVFVMGVSAFPQNFGYNPTAFVGALAYRSANAIRERRLKIPKVLA